MIINMSKNKIYSYDCLTLSFSEKIMKHKIKLAVVGKKDNINYFGERVAVN